MVDYKPTTSMSYISKGRTPWHHSSTEASTFSQGLLLHSSFSIVAFGSHSQLASVPIPPSGTLTAIKAQLQNIVHTAHKEGTPGVPSSSDGGDCATGLHTIPTI